MALRFLLTTGKDIMLSIIADNGNYSVHLMECKCWFDGYC